MIFDNGSFDETTYKFYKDIPKPKPGEITIVGWDNRLYEIPPYVNTGKKIPSWFKTLPAIPGSLRRCAGVGDYLQTGITIPMWTNIFFEPSLNDQRKWNMKSDRLYNSNEFPIEGFSFQQTGKCPITDVREVEDSYYPKLVNPFMLITHPGWSCLYLPASYEPRKEYDVLPAIVHTDFYHTANIVLNIRTDRPFKIEAGTPMVHVIPFERKNDFEHISFLDSSNFGLVHGRGLGDGHLQPNTEVSGTSAPYRRTLKKVDTEIADQDQKKSKKKFWFFGDKK